jgi:hypothetical protein
MKDAVASNNILVEWVSLDSIDEEISRLCRIVCKKSEQILKH